MRVLRELKRRKVLHTLSLYIVGCWVALQVIEVLSDAGLPPATMRFVLFAMSFGFPVVLVIAWFYDVSAAGISRTPPAEPGAELPSLNLRDHALLAGIVAVVALNIFVLLSPAPDTTSTPPAAEQRTLAVLGFQDIGTDSGSTLIGLAIASELREELTRIAGLKVLGPETSRVIQAAGNSRDAIAAELGVTALLTGDVRLHDGKLEMQTRLISLPAGNTVWQEDHQSDVQQGARLQQRVVQAVIDAILPPASAQTAQGPRIKGDECDLGYELFLRSKQLRATQNWQRGLELLQESVEVSPDCAAAWEELASASLLLWRKTDLAKAGAAARRALELNESMPKAWTVLAEIAEEEQRWGEAEELLLRVLYVDPTSAFANMQYAEALLARGRVREARHYALEAYRYEPASHAVNWKIALVADYLGDSETLLKHANIYRELRGNNPWNGWGELAEAHRLLGDVDQALAYLKEGAAFVPDWYPQCVRASLDPALAPAMVPIIREALDEFLQGERRSWPEMFRGGCIIQCASWVGAPDIAIELYESESNMPTEAKFLMFFRADASNLRATEHFRSKVVESGLLDYWREWGWSDYCRPDGDSFVCD
jgi:TolB-like protein/Tfp pilus assembly protein PilF